MSIPKITVENYNDTMFDPDDKCLVFYEITDQGDDEIMSYLAGLSEEDEPHLCFVSVPYDRIHVFPDWPQAYDDEISEVVHNHRDSPSVNWMRVVLYCGASIDEVEKIARKVHDLSNHSWDFKRVEDLAL